MRRSAALAVAVLAALPAAAPAAVREVRVGGNAFTPETVAIAPGDTVTWRWAGPDTNHSVTSEAGQAESFDSDPGIPTPAISHPVGFTFSHTFTRAGTFSYLCRVHPDTMRGKVLVGDDPGSPGGEDTTRPRIGSLRARPARFCKRHRRCARPGTRLTFTLTEPADLRVRAIGRVSGRRIVRTFELGRGRAGRNSERFHPSRLPEGSYALTLFATDDAGNASTARTRIRIVPPPRRR